MVCVYLPGRDKCIDNSFNKMKKSHSLFSSGNLLGLELRNKIIRSGCFEGMSQGGDVTDKLIEHHREVAAGGAAMTTVAYCSVSFDGRAFENEIWMRKEIIPDLHKLTDTVHNEGAAASIQLGHCGYFASKKVIKKTPVGASRKFNLFRLSYCREMTKDDIEEKVEDFGRAAAMAKQAGFDAVEVHAGHGYLLSQFVSPYTNHRNDKYGGSVENRMRFPVEIIKRIRKYVGNNFPILVKMNQYDGIKDGLQIKEAVEVAKYFEKAGADALIPSCGFTSKTPFYMLRGNVPIKEMVSNQNDIFMKAGLTLFGKFMVEEVPFDKLFLADGARRIKDAVSIPVIYIGGAVSLTDMENIIDEGFKFIQMGRATIRDPQFVNKLKNGEVTESDCDHCNRCVAAMDAGGVYCVTHKEEERLTPNPNDIKFSTN